MKKLKRLKISEDENTRDETSPLSSDELKMEQNKESFTFIQQDTMRFSDMVRLSQKIRNKVNADHLQKTSAETITEAGLCRKVHDVVRSTFVKL